MPPFPGGTAETGLRRNGREIRPCSEPEREYSKEDARSVKGSEVRVEHADKSFGDFHALKDVSLEIKKGEFFSLLGPSGCGKTTLLRIIAGLETPSNGTVYIDGINVIPIPANKRHVNTVFQSYALFPHLSVFENVAFPLRLRKTPGPELDRKVREYLSLVELSGQEHKMPNQLSGGQKQRVAIARALINEPSVLLLDEPLSALDAKLRQHMLIELDTIHDKIGITFIYVTHDQAEALSVSDRVAVMNRGRVLQIGTPREIYESPADVFVADFIGETNLFSGIAESVADGTVELSVQDLGTVRVQTEKTVAVGDKVRFTIRPEKITVSHKPPANPEERYNLFAGEVEEVIYSGFQSKIFIQTEGRARLRALKQHHAQAENGSSIQWKDRVQLWWSSRDAFVVEVRPQ